jgi:predicted RNase H-like HicB family nuclease
MKVRDVLRLLKDPDLPGCAATGQTIEETEQQIREAIDLHLRGMREDGLPIPEPSRVLTMWR